MDSRRDPRWIVTYRRAGAAEDETLTVHAPDLVAALRQARSLLDDASKTWTPSEGDALAEARPYRVVDTREAAEAAA